MLSANAAMAYSFGISRCLTMHVSSMDMEERSLRTKTARTWRVPLFTEGCKQTHVIE